MSGHDGTPRFDPTVPGCFLGPDYFEVLARLRADAPVQQVAPGLFTVARLETRVFFEELLARFPEYVVHAEPTWVPSTLVRGMATLPVVLTA